MVALPKIRQAMVSQLRKLSLKRCASLVCIAAIAACSQLQTLDVSSTRVRDVSALRGLTQLHTLNLDLTSVTDLAPISSLVQLTKLSLTGTAVQDLSPLSALTALQVLEMEQCAAVTSLASLASLTSLTAQAQPRIHQQVRFATPLPLSPHHADPAVKARGGSNGKHRRRAGAARCAHARGNRGR
jgi:hypothetical protein